MVKYFLPFLLFLAGCGGGGSESSGRPAENSPYQGAYTGEYRSAHFGDEGTFSISVTASGVVSGTQRSRIINADGTVAGTITNDGYVNVTSRFPGRSTGRLTGNLTQNGATLSGVLNETIDGDNGTVNVTLTKE